jgi:nitroreductase
MNLNHDALKRAQPLSLEDTTAALDATMRGRRSIRAFVPTPVPRTMLEELLDAAARAPSGTNTQPWKVYALSGASKDALAAKMCAAYDDPAERARHTEAYAYYPTEWVSPYIDRRRKVGWDLYGLLGIGKADKERMHVQHRRNFSFFDAPVALIFTIDRVMEKGSWLDYGMFLQSVMLAARARGLDTCPQAAISGFHRIVMPHVGAGDNEVCVCGMSLGYADPKAIENTLVTERAPASSFAHFLD